MFLDAFPDFAKTNTTLESNTISYISKQYSILNQSCEQKIKAEKEICTVQKISRCVYTLLKNLSDLIIIKHNWIVFTRRTTSTNAVTVPID